MTDNENIESNGLHPKIEVDSDDGDNYNGFDNITETGPWTSNFFVKVNGGGFTVGNLFCYCNHRMCGATSDTDCEEEQMAVQVTVGQDLTITNLNKALSVLEDYVVENEHGGTPIVGCLYNVDTSVCEESLNLLQKLGFTGEIPEPQSFRDDDDNTDDADV